MPRQDFGAQDGNARVKPVPLILAAKFIADRQLYGRRQAETFAASQFPNQPVRFVVGYVNRHGDNPEQIQLTTADHNG